MKRAALFVGLLALLPISVVAQSVTNTQSFTAAGTDGTAFFFNGYLSKFPLDASIGKALTVACSISIDNNVTVVYGAGPV